MTRLFNFLDGADDIIWLLGRHDAFVEPFVGEKLGKGAEHAQVETIIVGRCSHGDKYVDWLAVGGVEVIAGSGSGNGNHQLFGLHRANVRNGNAFPDCSGRLLLPVE